MTSPLLLRSPQLLALDVSSLHPAEGFGFPTRYVALCAGFAALAIIGIVLVAALSKPRRARIQAPGAHAVQNQRMVWHRRIEEVVQRHEAGELNRVDAFSELAEIVRAYASATTGSDMAAHTLADFNAMPRTAANREGVDLLRQTIAALYPPEFADFASNAQAKTTTVRQAAGWVSNLVERWRP